ncbi:MAG: YicC/YloC family endoribonuclease [Bacteroidales bacterium]
MIKSMTGFGKAEVICRNQKIIIEVKSLNSKFFDVNTRLPNGFRDKELEVRNLLSVKLQRGKIDFSLILEESADMGNFSINKELAKKYFKELTELSGDFGVKDHTDYLPVIMRMPDVLVPARNELDEEEWSIIKRTINQALDHLEEFRLEEGKSLEMDMVSRSKKIMTILEEIKPFEKQRIETLKTRIKKDVFETVDKEDVDMNRFEQELIYYIEKLDITEETVRLKNHCLYFNEILKERESQGKKLGFITQEMGREINTLGSKANDADIQKLVVQMKDELEKIKEQLYNIL